MWSSPEAEKSLIACVMLDPECAAYACQRIVPEDFSEPLHEGIFRVALGLYSAGRAIDLVTLTENAGKASADPVTVITALSEMARMLPTTAHYKTYADIVQEKSMRRKLAKVAQATMTAAKDDAREITKSRDQAMDALYNIRRFEDGEERTDASSIMLAGMRYAQQRASAGDSNLTGIADIDNVMGGLHPGEMTVLAARPGEGKSTLAWQIGEKFAERGQRVVFVSCEMSKEQIATRWWAMHGVSSERVRAGTMTERDWELATEASDMLSKYPVHTHTASRKPADIRTAIQGHMRAGGIGLVIVDYLQLLIPNRDTKAQTTNITQISRDLKLLTTEFSIPLLVLSQLSRAPVLRGNKMPVLSDLRDSGAIEQDADNVLFLMMPKKAEDAMPGDSEEYEQARSGGNYLTYCTLAKHRNGPLTESRLLFNPKSLRMYSLAHDFTPIDDTQVGWEGETG